MKIAEKAITREYFLIGEVGYSPLSFIHFLHQPLFINISQLRLYACLLKNDY